MTFKDHFSSLAAQYSAFRPTYPAPLFDYLAERSPRRGLVWDCACGSGQASIALADRFDRVVATDASPQQIAAAWPNPRVTYRVAAADSSGLDTGTVDLVTVAQALHWLDLNSFYREVDRVLAETGLVAVWSYGVLHVEGDEVDRLIQRFYHETVGPDWPAERKLVDDGYRALAFPFAEMTPPSFDMRERWSQSRLLGYLRTWSATARYVERTGTDPVDALTAELKPYWPEAASERTVKWPLALRVGRRKDAAVNR